MAERGLVDLERRDRPRPVVVHDRELEPERLLEPDHVRPRIAAAIHERPEEGAVARNQVAIRVDVCRRRPRGEKEDARECISA